MRLNVPIGVRWSDLDAYGHVNNAAMLRLLEEARIHAFWDPGEAEGVLRTPTAVLDGSPGSRTLTLIARQEIEYLVPIPYLRAALDIQLWLGKLGGASLEVCYEVHSPLGVADDTVYTRASTTIVLVDSSTNRPRRINDTERIAWGPYVDGPVLFARHR